jgi:hypothetical protein
VHYQISLYFSVSGLDSIYLIVMNFFLSLSHERKKKEIKAKKEKLYHSRILTKKRNQTKHNKNIKKDSYYYFTQISYIFINQSMVIHIFLSLFSLFVTLSTSLVESSSPLQLMSTSILFVVLVAALLISFDKLFATVLLDSILLAESLLLTEF